MEELKQILFTDFIIRHLKKNHSIKLYNITEKANKYCLYSEMDFNFF